MWYRIMDSHRELWKFLSHSRSGSKYLWILNNVVKHSVSPSILCLLCLPMCWLAAILLLSSADLALKLYAESFMNQIPSLGLTNTMFWYAELTGPDQLSIPVQIPDLKPVKSEGKKKIICGSEILVPRFGCKVDTSQSISSSGSSETRVGYFPFLLSPFENG